jgi:hypothetical protein
MTTRNRLFIALGATLVLVAMAQALPADGDSRGPAILSIFGKWHLLILHFPIALLFVLPALELWHPEAAPSRPVLLIANIAAGGTWLATALGILHGHFNGFSGTDVDDHSLLGIVATAEAGIAWALIGLGRRTRITLQCIAALGVAVAAHVGGEMVHDEGFLTEPSKPSVKETVTLDNFKGFSLVPSAHAATPDERRQAYEQAVRPILEAHCTACHDAKKSKGKLRLDSIEAIEKGGSEGAGLVWGKSTESRIVQRSTLPRSDEESMPPEPKKMLTPEQVAVIKGWIDGKAVVAAAALKVATKVKTHPEQTFSANEKVGKQAEAIVNKLGVTANLRAVENDAGMIVTTHAIAAQFTDKQLSTLAESAGDIAEMDLSRTPITDASSGAIARFSKLEVLAVSETKVGDGFVKAAANLPHLRRLILRGTQVTDIGLMALIKTPELQAVYISQTSCTPVVIAALQKARPDLKIIGAIQLADIPVPPPPTKEEAMKKAAIAKEPKK